MIFRFTLDDGLGNSLTLNSPSYPKEWEKVEFALKRDPTWHGLFTNFSLPIEFVCEGYEFIKNFYNNYNIFRPLYIYIYVKCQPADAWDEFFVGRLNLESLELKDINPPTARCNIEQADNVMQFKARYDRALDLKKGLGFENQALTPLTHCVYPVLLRGKTLLQTTAFETCPTENCELNNEFSPNKHYIHGQTPPYNPFRDWCWCNIVDELGAFTDQNDCDNIWNTGDPPMLTIPDEICNYQICIELRFRIKFPPCFLLVGAPALFEIRFYNSAPPAGLVSTIIVSTADLVGDAPFVNGADYAQEFCYELIDCGSLDAGSYPPGTPLFMLAYYDLINYQHTGGGCTFDCDDAEPPFSCFVVCWDCTRVSLTCPSTEPDTPCQSAAVYEAGARLTEAIGGGFTELNFKSDYFGRTNSEPEAYGNNGCGSFEVITSGLNIRQYPTTTTNEGGDCPCPQQGQQLLESPIFCSFKDFWEGLNAVHNLGLGITKEDGIDTVRVEPKYYFYNTDVLLACPNVKDSPMRMVATEYLFSQIEIGYDKFELQQGVANGRDEFNTRRRYHLPANTVSQNEISYLSNLIASGYAIEAARRKPFMGTGTEDFEYDNDLFLICVRQDVAFMDESEQNERFPTVNNVLDPATSFNLAISPRKNLSRWSYILNAPIYPAVSGTYKFLDGEGNYVAQIEEDTSSCCWETGVLIAENQDLDATTPTCGTLFKSEKVSFDYPLSYTEYKAIKANPFGLVTFSTSGSNNFEAGWILEMKYSPQKSMAKFTLILQK